MHTYATTSILQLDCLTQGRKPDEFLIACYAVIFRAFDLVTYASCESFTVQYVKSRCWQRAEV